MSKLNELMQGNPIKNEIAVKNEEGKTSKIFLYGTVGSYYGFSLNRIQEALKNIEGNEIEIHINSYGGDLFEGIAIKNLLKQRDEKIIIYIDGIAASAASIIAMSGDEIIIPADAQLMIHNPWTFAAGNAKELHKIADDLIKMQTSLEESYLKRFVGSREELKTLLDEETYLTAEESIAFGLADRLDEAIIEDKVKEKTSAKAKLLETLNSSKKEIAAETKKPEEEQKEIKSMNIFENLINIMEAK